MDAVDSLKHDSRTAHIPVHIISGHENNKRGFALGAVTCIPKESSRDSLDQILSVVERSMERRKKTLLLIAENDVRSSDIHNLLAGDDLEIIDVPDLPAAEAVLRTQRVDGVVLDWVLPEAAGIEFIERIQASRFCWSRR